MAVWTVVVGCIIWTTAVTVNAQGHEHTSFSKQVKPQSLSFGTLAGQEYLQFSFYLHDNLDTRPGASAVTVVPPVQSMDGIPNLHGFGAIAVFDDAMTEGPDPSSQSIGRGRGFYVFNAMVDNGASLEFVWTAVFNDASGFGGSTISFKGYDKIDDEEREIAITGGTGKFRLARGWATIRTSAANGGAAKLYLTCSVYYGADLTYSGHTMIN
ncbi:hypothetical protein R1sor_022106 [Riccia sorocarpa]|uniref:Dirigent protein n=1 Tax=Riccia sorocarpa TaxID=122646 RepID=A0ABD3GM96_9MARC